MAYDIRGSYCDFQRDMGPNRENPRYHCFKGIIFFAELVVQTGFLHVHVVFKDK